MQDMINYKVCFKAFWNPDKVCISLLNLTAHAALLHRLRSSIPLFMPFIVLCVKKTNKQTQSQFIPVFFVIAAILFFTLTLLLLLKVRYSIEKGLAFVCYLASGWICWRHFSLDKYSTYVFTLSIENLSVY